MGRLDLRDPLRDEDVPDEHDYVTAAHLRNCGFCRAVILGIVSDHAYETSPDREYD